jgi:chromosome segregation ATPase
VILNSYHRSHFGFLAIQFVMANEFDHIPTEQLSSMIHHSEKVASVEIVFSNDDQRLPVS